MTNIKGIIEDNPALPPLDKVTNEPSETLISTRINSAISALASSSSPSSECDQFFKDCSINLAKAFEAKYAFIGIFEDETKSSIRSLAVSADGKIIDNITYNLKGTPCQDCLNQHQILIERNVAELYPDDVMITEMKLESYFGRSIFDQNGIEMGIVVILDTSPMHKDHWKEPVFSLFADRISLELERIKSQNNLRLAASVFEGCQEGIMLLDTNWKIRKANKAYTKISGWSEEELKGHSILKQSADHQTNFSLAEVEECLTTRDHWQGEIWCHQKNGNIYPENRTISVVRDTKTNSIIHYICMSTDISEQKYADQRIKRLAKFDQITDLPNRHHFNETLNEEIKKARKESSSLALMKLDLNGFKIINEIRGHSTGDRLLKLIGERFQCLPAKTIFTARTGGDEFTLLIKLKEKGNSKDTLSECATQIIELMSHPYMLDGEETVITASIGIALFENNKDDAQSLIKKADHSLDASKKKGKNCFEFYKPEHSRKVESQFALATLLRKAISQNQFEMYYQSKLKAQTHELIGYEALIRWKLDDGAIISPGQFIPVAEETGMITDIGKWVITEVFTQSKKWQNSGFHFGRLAINISGRQLSNEDFFFWFENLLKETQTNPSNFELEITESWLIEDPDKSAKLLAKLHDLGFHLSIDDFGVAHSSLNYLKCFPIDTIKIDRSFTRDIMTSEESMAIVSAIIAIGNNLNLKTLAEGVETKDQLKKLEAAGCNEFQGFYFSKPEPVSVLEKKHSPHTKNTNDESELHVVSN